MTSRKQNATTAAVRLWGLLALWCGIAAAAHAQYDRIKCVSAPAGYSVRQIDLEGGNTVVHMQFKSPADSFLFSLSSKMVLETPGGTVSLAEGLHAPLSNEAEQCYAFLPRKGDVVNFSLVFYRIEPRGRLTLKGRDYGGKPVVMHGITVSWIDSVPAMDADSFAAQTPVKRYGHYFHEGQDVYYGTEGDVGVSMTVRLDDELFRYFSVHCDVQNYSPQSVLVGTGKMSAVANGRQMKVLPPDDYNRKMATKDSWEALTVGLGSALASAMLGVGTRSRYYTSNRYVRAEENIERNLRRLERIQYEDRMRIKEGYMTLNTLRPGTEYSGCFYVEYKKTDNLTICCRIGNSVFYFPFRWEKELTF